jgi:general secretion pathway protein B
MSFILDALKKSEAERQRQAGPALLEMRIVRPARRLPAWAVVAGVALLACVLVLAWVALRRGGAPGSSAAPAPTVASGTTGAVTMPGSVPGMVNAGAAGGASPPAAAAAPAAGAVAPLASAPAAVTAPVTTASSNAQSATSAGEDNPADAEPAEAPVASTLSPRADTRGLRNYTELGGTTPELRLDLHVYAAKPAERYAFINMHKVREGEVTPEGMEVKEITPEGVVLEYHGTEFLLGR